ncbi:MAG TPA: AraC family transcriptional regulator [Armatimonadota bacterium]|jgi:AraC-like DNA-binding protein
MCTPPPLTSYRLRELRRIAALVGHLTPTLALAARSLRMQQVRMDHAPSRESSPPHGHADYEAILVLHGQITYTDEETRLLRAGDALLYPPSVRHAWQTHDDSCLRLVLWFASTPAIAVPRARYPVTCPEMLWDVALLVHEVQTMPPGWHERLPLRLTTLMSRLLSHPQDPQDAPVLRGTATDQLALIQQFLCDNLGEPLTLAVIAEHVGMSERSLHRYYQRMAGHTLWTTLQRLRLEQAAMLLVDADMSISEIAARVGMPNLAYFCARFRQCYQLSPGQYRHAMCLGEGG